MRGSKKLGWSLSKISNLVLCSTLLYLLFTYTHRIINNFQIEHTLGKQHSKTHWIRDLININCPFICNVKEHVISRYSFLASLLITEHSNHVNFGKLKVEKKNLHEQLIINNNIIVKITKRKEINLGTEGKEKENKPKNEVNPFM